MLGKNSSILNTEPKFLNYCYSLLFCFSWRFLGVGKSYRHGFGIIWSGIFQGCSEIHKCVSILNTEPIMLTCAKSLLCELFSEVEKSNRHDLNFVEWRSVQGCSEKLKSVGHSEHSVHNSNFCGILILCLVSLVLKIWSPNCHVSSSFHSLHTNTNILLCILNTEPTMLTFAKSLFQSFSQKCKVAVTWFKRHSTKTCCQ